MTRVLTMGVEAFITARDRLLAIENEATSSREVCEEIVRTVQSLAPFDWCAVMTTDPATLLPSGGVVVGFDQSACLPFWDNELLDPDFNKFTDLALRHDPVATLHDAVAGALLDSYGLTPRETEIVLWLCRGMSAKEIAAELILSAHTVRDHIKVIYDKAGVNSRGELVAGLFSTHVLDRFEGAVSHLTDL